MSAPTTSARAVHVELKRNDAFGWHYIVAPSRVSSAFIAVGNAWTYDRAVRKATLAAQRWFAKEDTRHEFWVQERA